MPAQLHRLRTKADRLRADEAGELRRLILEHPTLPERARGEIIATIDRQAASEAGWTFVMLSPEQNAAVMRWLHRHSKRPRIALALWGELFTALRRDTGQIMLTRDELADRIGTYPDHISQIMGELADISAVTVRRERVAGMRGPGRAVYFMNPTIGTNLAGAARDRAQAEAPPLRLVRGE
jgi:hypothetical protein